MPHPLVLALFDSAESAAIGARAAHDAGVPAEELSIVAKDHQQEGELARRWGGTPGVELEDSPTMSRLGEFSGHLLAAIAIVLPGIGPIVAGGPMAAALGEAAGHAAGGLASLLERSGVSEEQASVWERRIDEGAVLLGVHVISSRLEPTQAALASSGAREIVLAEWE